LGWTPKSIAPPSLLVRGYRSHQDDERFARPGRGRVDTCLAEEAFTQALVAYSEDVRSFMEKRPPTSNGR